MKRVPKYKQGDEIEVIVSPNGYNMLGKIGKVIEQNGDLVKIEWNSDWIGYLNKDCIKKVGAPEIFEMIEIKITPTNDEKSKGVLSFKHRGKIKKIVVIESCPYNACKNLVSYFKQDPIKYSVNH